MPQVLFHSSIEGAQHGPKGLVGFLDFAQDCGAEGAQPTNCMLEDGEGGFVKAGAIRDLFELHGLLLDGVSAHCPFWVHGTAWTGSKTIWPFIPGEVAQLGDDKIEQWAEDYILRLLDLCAELNVRVVPMFWGTLYGWEVATGYPWGFWAGGNGDLKYDLLQEGDERFVTKTGKIRARAKELGIVLAHEVHPGTAAMTAPDFLRLVDICDDYSVCDDPLSCIDGIVLGVNADPSHCWEGESWQARFSGVGDRVVGCHVKNHRVQDGFPLRYMEADWWFRGMQFTPLDQGDINLVEYAERMIQIGYPSRYCTLMGTETAPLVCEAEAAYRDLDDTSRAGIGYINDTLCFAVATESFEEGMGTQD